MRLSSALLGPSEKAVVGSTHIVDRPNMGGAASCVLDTERVRVPTFHRHVGMQQVSMITSYVVGAMYRTGKKCTVLHAVHRPQ
ncbi:hypothetical protein VTK73DRAFT_6172 [Phialemonium thermophilum]|uniref:Uncharacterized protein n=1 Tax=Phialemonium thermophilum TaxID=223376 RepID=A0ABR3V173_9PEZI